MRKGARVDKLLALCITVLVLGGGLLFASAAFGLLARGASNMSSVAFKQVLWIGVGLVALVIASRLDYKLWRRFAPHLFVLALIATAAVFIPSLVVEHGGGRRWILLAGVSFQPSEALKVGSILLAAACFGGLKARIEDIRYGLGGLLLILAGPTLLLLAQPDLGTLGVIVISVLAIFLAAGARWRDLALMVVFGLVALVILASVRPYVLDRMTVFFNPSQAPQAEGYQIKQSLIAIGSGGFVGSIILIGIFLAFALRGFSVGARAPDPFGALLAIGISTYLVSEAFINIGAMLGVAPLTGIPLTFISQGGSAMLVSLASAGILLSVSRNKGRN